MTYNAPCLPIVKITQNRKKIVVIVGFDDYYNEFVYLRIEVAEPEFIGE
jgi:hypothetical protein